MKSKTPLKAGDEVVAENATEVAFVVHVQGNSVVKLDRPIQGQVYWPSAMLERRDPLLGDMLAKLWDRAAEDCVEKSEPKMRGTRERELKEATRAIELDIDRGILPCVKIPLSIEDWLNSCIVHEDATVDVDLWRHFKRRFALSGLGIRKDRRDGASCLVAYPLGVDV